MNNKDTLPKRDTTFSSNYEIIKDIKYRAYKAATFETIDARSFSRRLEEETIQKSLSETFSNLSREFIFNSRDFEGDFVDFIADKEGIDRKEVYNIAKVIDAINNIPSYLKTRTSNS